MEDFSRAKEDSKEEDSTKAKALTTMEEEDSKEEVSNKDWGLEEAEATSTRLNSTSNTHLVLPVTAAPSQPTKLDIPIGKIIITTKTIFRIHIPTNAIQTKDGADNQSLMR